MEIFEMEKEFNDLVKAGQELIEKMKEKQNADDSKTKRWKPEVGDVFYIINYAGVVIECGNTNEVEINACFHFGNCFKTKEDAQKELDRRIAEQELLNMCDWYDDTVYCMIYNRSSESFEVNLYHSFIPTPYHFDSIESAKKAIDTLGMEKLKLIFRID